jgi:hypothetical protein
MELFKQLMKFGKTGLQGLPTRVTLFLWAFSRQGGVRVRRPFGARGRSSVRYGTGLGDLKESWFILFSN